MASHDLIKKLSETLITWLTAGIRIDTETADMLASTWDCRCNADLSRLLADPDESDAQTALELLFFPSSALCARVEEIVGTTAIDVSEEAALIQKLTAGVSQAILSFENDSQKVTLRPPEWLLATTVGRLRLDHPPAPDISRATRRLSESDRSAVLIRLRHSKIDLAQTDFLKALITGADPELDPIVALVEEVVPLLETLEPKADRFEAMEIRKRRLFRAAQIADAFEQKLAHQNIETLMLQGHPLPTMGASEARERMRRIDQICRAAFGRVPVIEPPDFVSDAGVIDPTAAGKAADTGPC